MVGVDMCLSIKNRTVPCNCSKPSVLLSCIPRMNYQTKHVRNIYLIGCVKLLHIPFNKKRPLHYLCICLFWILYNTQQQTPITQGDINPDYKPCTRRHFSVIYLYFTVIVCENCIKRDRRKIWQSLWCFLKSLPAAQWTKSQ